MKGAKMKFYLSSAKNWGYADLKNNELIQNYVREIEKEAGTEVTIAEDYQYIVIDIPSIKVLAQLMKVIGKDLVIEQQSDKDDQYPTICIYDDYIE